MLLGNTLLMACNGKLAAFDRKSGGNADKSVQRLCVFLTDLLTLVQIRVHVIQSIALCLHQMQSITLCLHLMQSII